jgi:hypothetical protein
MSVDLKTQLRGFAQALSEDLPVVEHHTPEFRNHAWHWGSIIDSRTRPKPIKRFPLWRDLMVATLTGLLIGSSIVFTLIRGFFPPAGALGVTFLVVHLVALWLGQYVDEARLSRWDLQKIATVGAGAMLAGALLSFVLMV